MAPLQYAVHHLRPVDHLVEPRRDRPVKGRAPRFQVPVLPPGLRLQGVPKARPGQGVHRPRRGHQRLLDPIRGLVVVQQHVAHLPARVDVEVAPVLPAGDGRVLHHLLPGPRLGPGQAQQKVPRTHLVQRPQHCARLLGKDPDVGRDRRHFIVRRQPLEDIAGVAGRDPLVQVVRQLVQVPVPRPAEYPLDQSPRRARPLPVLVPVNVVLQALQVLHRPQPRRVGQHLVDVVGVHGEDAVQHHRVVGLGDRSLRDPLLGDGLGFGLLGVVSGHLVPVYVNGEVMLLFEFLIAVDF